MPQEELTLKAIDRDPWNAVTMQLPVSPSPLLLERAHWIAEYCCRAATNRAKNPNWIGRRAFEPAKWPLLGLVGPLEAAGLAMARLEQLEALDGSLLRTGAEYGFF